MLPPRDRGGISTMSNLDAVIQDLVIANRILAREEVVTWHGVDDRLWSKAGARYSSRIGPRMALSRRSRLRV
jgi:hypothetical protein